MLTLSAIAIFIAVFAIATARKAHLGILMFPAACAVGVLMAGLTLKEVIGGFPVSIMVLLVGVTFFFGIAQVNGTIDRVIALVLAHVGGRPAVLPFVFFALAGAIAAMGSPVAGLVLAPICMPLAKRSRVDSMLMAVAINSGISAGGFAPTSLFGIVTYGTARQAGIALSPFTLFGVAIVANFALLLAAFVMFRRASAVVPESHSEAIPNPGIAAPSGPFRFERNQGLTIACMVGLIASVIYCVLAGVDPDIGVISIAFGAILMLLDPATAAKAVSRIDWSTVLVVGGIITYVGVLQKMGSVNFLADAATHIGTPLVAALVICMISGLASAFASTTGILAALVPLAVPLATSGGVQGWALICALGVCASIVDISPFSTTGATLVASAAEEDRPRLRSLTMRWGMSMVVLGPAILVAGLALLGAQ